MKPIFILFPGFGSSKLWWNYKETGTDKLKKVDFVDRLKKLGHVYLFTYKFFNYFYYYQNKDPKERLKWQNIYKKYKPHTPDIDFDLENLDFDVICKQIYTDVRKKYEHNKLIPIGHSYGAGIAIQFSQMYKKECLFAVSIDGTHQSLNLQKTFFTNYERQYENVIKRNLNTNNDLHAMLDKINNSIINHTNVNNDIDKITKLINYKSRQYRIKYFNKVLAVPVLFIRVFYAKEILTKHNKLWNKWTVSEMNDIEKYNNGNMYKYRIMINADHFVWNSQKYSDEIIDDIHNWLELYQ